MRTTVTLDPDVQILLKEAAHRSGRPLKTTLNEAVRAGLLGKVLILLSSTRGFQNHRPTVLILGQQHGNEPAGGEAALALTEQLLKHELDLLAQVNVLVMPRANPDGAQNFVRATANGLDVNRDHLLLQTPEGQAIAATALRYKPQVVMDLHEFTVGDRWLAKFAGYAKYDVLLQASTVGNMDQNMAALALRDFVAVYARR